MICNPKEGPRKGVHEAYYVAYNGVQLRIGEGLHKSHHWDHYNPAIDRVNIVSGYHIYLDRENHEKNCLNIRKVFGNKRVLLSHKKHANAETNE